MPKQVMYQQKMKRITVTLPNGYVEVARRLGGGNVSEGIRMLFDVVIDGRQSVRGLLDSVGDDGYDIGQWAEE